MSRNETPVTSAASISPAEEAARQTVELDPQSPLAWHGLAFALIEAGKLAEASACLQRTIALDPGSVMARNNLGIVLHRLGETAKAAEVYGAALALEPDNAAVHNNLACVLSELGQFQACLAHATRAVAADPGQLGAYVYAAIAEAHLDRKHAALGWLDRALGLDPQNVRVTLERADLLRVLGRLDDALASGLAAVAAEPNNAKAWNVLGLIHQAQGRDEDAITAFDRAAPLTPHPATVYANKAIVLLELGRRDAALASLDLALAAEPGLAAGWFVRSDLKTFVPGDPDLAAMEAALAQPGRSTQETILLRYALGKAHLDAGDAAQAFAHLNQGARLKRLTVAYDAAAAEREMAALADAFPASLFARRQGAGDPSEAPVFIVGMPRSGGTLIEQILASHPQVQAGGEARHVELISQSLGPAYPREAGGLTDPAIAALGRRYLQMAGLAPGAARITDKAANHFLHLGLIHLILPRARIIHCRRDPADIGLSCYSKLFTTGQEFSYDQAELGGYYRLYAHLMEHWRAVIAPDRFIEVAYEDVVDDLEGQARRLIDFCGLDWTEACLRFHETDRTVRTASLNQVRRPLYRTSVGRWRAYREQLRPLLTALGGQDGDV